MGIKYDISDVMRDIDAIPGKVRAKFEEAGRDGVEYAKAHGNYKNRTGHLRASNGYRADEKGLEMYNDADYASNVESRGYDVISGAYLHTVERLEHDFSE